VSEKARAVGVASGALGLGGFAAALGLCCSVPWAVALLGVTGAVFFARLAFLMPYALVGSIALLVFGFWLAYRRPVCATGVCEAPRSRTLQWIMWGAAITVAGLGTVAWMYRVTTI